MKPYRKKIRVLVCATLFVFVPLAGMAMAQAKPAAPAAQDITGKVAKGKYGLVLKAAEGEYILAGEDLSKMVGKKIIATGTISGSGKEGKKVLTVSAVKEVPADWTGPHGPDKGPPDRE